jgi:hypothetical protein
MVLGREVQVMEITFSFGHLAGLSQAGTVLRGSEQMSLDAWVGVWGR